MTNIVPFEFKGEVFRIVDQDGEMLFVGQQVAKALGYADTDQAIRKHCKHARIFKPVELTGLGIQSGPRGMMMIPEGDVMRLIVKSNLPAAQEFESKVFDEILPQIRKTGTYGAPDLTFPASVEAFSSAAREVIGGIMKGIALKQREELQAYLEEQMRLSERALIERMDARTMVAAISDDATITKGKVRAWDVVYKMAKVPPDKKCKNLVRMVSDRLEKFCKRRSVLTELTHGPYEVRLFPYAAAKLWLDDPRQNPEGGGGYNFIWAYVNEKEAQKRGQNVFPFPKGTPEKTGA